MTGHTMVENRYKNAQGRTAKKEETHWKRDHHKLSTAGSMSVDDDPNFTYRKLLSTRSAIPS